MCRQVTDPREASVEPDRIEYVARIPVLVAASLKVFETRDRYRFDVLLRREARHHGKGRAGVGAGFRHPTGALHLISSPIKHDHLAIEIGEGAKAEIAMLQDRFDTDLSVIDARDQGSRGRDLEQGVNRYAEILGQGCRDDRRGCSFDPCDLSVQRCLERCRNSHIEICHRFAPTHLQAHRFDRARSMRSLSRTLTQTRTMRLWTRLSSRLPDAWC